MPTYQRFGSNNHESRKDRRKPAIEQNEEPAVVVSETSPALQLAPQDHQLMSERGILSLKSDLRLEWGGQDRHDETQEHDHSDSLGDSGAASTRIKFSVHTGDNGGGRSRTVDARACRDKAAPPRPKADTGGETFENALGTAEAETRRVTCGGT